MSDELILDLVGDINLKADLQLRAESARIFSVIAARSRAFGTELRVDDDRITVT